MFSCHSGANLYPTCTQLWRFSNQLERISPSFLTHFVQKNTQAPLLVVCMLRDITIKTQIFIHLSAISIAPTAATSIASTASVAHGLSINLPARWLEFYSLLDPEFAPHFPPGLCRHLAIKACGMTSIFIPSLVKLHAARDERQTQLCHEITRMKKMVYMQHTSQPPKTSINEKSMYRSSTATSSSYSSLPKVLVCWLFTITSNHQSVQGIH